MSSDQTPHIPYIRIWIWGAVLLHGCWFFHKDVVSWFQPPPDRLADFIQEWLSARNHFAGVSVYENQVQALARHMPDVKVDPASFLPYNSHPPAAILIALPFGQTDYRTAHTAWNVFSFAVFVLSIVAVLYELARPLKWWYALPVLALFLWFEPVRANLIYGQLTFLLGGLLVAGWVADRRGYPVLAGLAVGLAAGLKLFPGLLLLYFLCARKWKAAAAMVVGAVGLNAIAAAVLGINSFEVYVRDVLPAVKFFQSSMLNISLHGFWNRFAYSPDLASPFGERPLIATIGLALSLFVVAIGVSWAGWRSGKENNLDRGWAVGIAAMTLASPIAWGHYFVLFVIPFGVLAHRTRTGPVHVVGWILVLLMCVKDTIYTRIFMTEHNKNLIQKIGQGHLVHFNVVELFSGVAWLTYANLVLFVLLLTLPRSHVTTASTATEPPASADAPPPSPVPGL